MHVNPAYTFWKSQPQNLASPLTPVLFQNRTEMQMITPKHFVFCNEKSVDIAAWHHAFVKTLKYVSSLTKMNWDLLFFSGSHRHQKNNYEDTDVSSMRCNSDGKS